MIRVADYIINKIYDEGARDIFTVTGRGILFLSDAAAKHEGMNVISVHHEQAGAYAAMAYAQTNGSIGACLVSTGCGATNAITSVLCAYQDSVPCIVVSGQNMLHETTRYTKSLLRTYGSQEADIIQIIQPITKYAAMICDPNQVVYELEKAIFLMRQGRPGPVWIDVPIDVQNMRIEPDELLHFDEQEYLLSENKDAKTQNDIEIIRKRKEDIGETDVLSIMKAMEEAKRPVILAGNGIRLAGAVDKFRNLVEKLQIPVVYSPAASDVYGSANKYSIGAVGSLGGTREGNFALQNADLILSLGCGLASVLTGEYPEKFARDAKVIVVDIDGEQHSKKNVSIDRLILADVKKVICELYKRTISLKPDKAWLDKCIHWKDIFPLGKENYDSSERVDLYYLAEKLGALVPEDTIVVCDAGFEELIIPSSVHYSNKQRCLHPAAQGAMGYALPASMGAWESSGRPVVAVIGDGSIMMNLQELQTIYHYNMPLKIIVINNNVYSIIRKRQQDLFRTRTIGTDPENGVSCPDFQNVAKCFGITYEHIASVGELDMHLESILKSEGAVLCEIDCMETQRYLHTSVARNEKNRLVHRPLEDMSPFMDRELFLEEMWIEPIDQ